MTKNKKITISCIMILFDLFLYYIVFYKNKVIAFDRISHIINIVLIMINILMILFNKNVKYKKYDGFIIYLTSLVISFMIGGKKLFLTENILSFPKKSLLLYVLISVLLLPIIHNIFYMIENINIKEIDSIIIRRKKSWKFFLLIFMIFTGIWTVAGISFFPGNITSDTTSQLAQALGFYGIDNAHPAFCTIIMRWLLKIWNNPFIILFTNIIFFSTVLAYIYKYLYENNANIKILFFSAILFAISCNNLSLMTMIWKDIPFTISLLWLTFEIYLISKQKEKYFIKNSNIIKLCISLLFTYFFRHNGPIPYIATMFYLILLMLKLKAKKRILLTIILSIISIWFVKNPFYTYYKVDSSNIMSSGPASFAAKGLGAVVHYNGKMTKKEESQIKKIARIEDLKKYYSPYSIDTYSFQNIGWDEGIARLGVGTIYRLYIQNLIENPKIIIRDRLDSCNLLWDFTTPKDSFNYKYDIGIAYPNYVKEFKGYEKNKGIKYLPKENAIMNLITTYQEYTEKVVILDIIFWRPALMLGLLLVLLINILRKKIKLLPITIPTLTSILFWIVLMSHQSYRYLWFLSVNVFYILLFVLLEREERLD